MHDGDRLVEDGGTPAGVPEDNAPGDDLGMSYGEMTGEDDFAEADTEAAAEAAPAECAEEAPTALPFVAPVFNNFMDVLYPAKPPVARNARIVRRFDLEAAKYDPRPSIGTVAPPAAPVPVPVEKKEPTLSREEARQMRNRSLRAAAGLR
jgi:hypothetical protein